MPSHFPRSEQSRPDRCSSAYLPMPMESTGRFFLCGRCRVQVLLCSHCDRGQIYCGDGCSKVARRRSLQESGQRYQRSWPGRLAHAERSRRYRQRRKNVTHQGSLAPEPEGLLSSPSAGAANRCFRLTVSSPITAWHCHRCGRRCAAFVRLGFRRRRGSHSILFRRLETFST
jgi:hypothetical protein